MRSPFRLVRRGAPGRVVAALCPGRQAAPALALCAQMGLDPSGRVFATAQGPLVFLDRPPSSPCVAAIFLRGLGARLFVPYEADLVPALLDDELDGMTRDRGLVFLPGGTCLTFDPAAPLDPSTLVEFRARPTRTWKPFPVHARLAERIVEIEVAVPEPGPSE